MRTAKKTARFTYIKRVSTEPCLKVLFNSSQIFILNKLLICFLPQKSYSKKID